MPILDMPLAELERYQGAPIPGDFDAYWEEALSQVEDRAYTIAPSDFSLPGYECSILTFTGVGGAQVGGKFIRPLGEGMLPGVVVFHGYRGNSGDFFNLLPYAAAGMAVFAMDVRGQMGISQDNFVSTGNTLLGHIVRGLEEYNPKRLFYRNVFLDTVQSVRILMSMPFVDAMRVGVTGGSQGGALATACAGLEPRVKVAAIAYPFLSDYRRVWEMDMGKRAYEELEYFIRWRDPLHERLEDMFRTLDYIDVSHLAPRIKARTHFFLTLQDDICPPSTQFAVYNNTPEPKSRDIYYNHGHEGLPRMGDRTLRFLLENL
ncbi:MAG: acetylxylan esterase [Clostridiales bacterium]|nr:acetylxylan esterase [Clostridiales bacterium]